jgi:hypothetical protein
VVATAARAQEPKPKVRELYVPFDGLDVLLEGQARRVMLSREEYQQLEKKAQKAPETHAPQKAILVSADYLVTVEPQRARLSGKLVIDVLEDGLHAVPLDLSDVGIRAAVLDGKPAAIGSPQPSALPAQPSTPSPQLASPGPFAIFVEGKGRHELMLEMVAPLETTAATQILALQLPRPPAAKLAMVVPGDVEVKSGADVASRVVDEGAGVTRFDLLPRAGRMSIVMTLNSHLQRRQRAVTARSLVVDEVTQAYERLHASVRFFVLHRAVDSFRLAVPEGFDVTEVSSPLLARWAMAAEDGRRVLDVKLREQTTETVTLELTAVRTPPRLEAWKMPRLEPLDVLGQVAVLGLLTDEQLRAEAIAPESLIPIDTDLLRPALPASVFRAEPGAPSLTLVAAYYAPRPDYALAARLVRPPVQTAVTTSVLLLLEESGPKIRGRFLITPETEKLFGLDFSVPAGWQVTSVTAADGRKLAFEFYAPVAVSPAAAAPGEKALAPAATPGEKALAPAATPGEKVLAPAATPALSAPGRVRANLPAGAEPGKPYRVDFEAQYTPGDWLARSQSTIEFPVFALAGASRDLGAIGVEARDELTVRPQSLDRLTPLDATEKSRFGLEGLTTNLVYRYESQPYKATIAIEKIQPRLTARTFSSFRVEPDALAVHGEVVYQLEQGRTRQVALLLPASTPQSVTIRGLDGLRIKESSPHPTGKQRRWDVLLEEPAADKVRLAVEFRQPLGQESVSPGGHAGLLLPIVAADGVQYQSGLVSVEGNPELEVDVRTAARRVDVGEFVDAAYQPGRSLLGVFSFIGDPAEVKINITRHPGYPLRPAIVELAEMHTKVSAAGVAETWALYRLRTKALYLQIDLAPQAELWTADLDGQPVKPQEEPGTGEKRRAEGLPGAPSPRPSPGGRGGGKLLVSLPAAGVGQTRTLQLVYQEPIRPLGMTGRVRIAAPKLWLRADRGQQPVEVPVADLHWSMRLPTGYQVTRSDGTVTTTVERPEPAVISLAKDVGELFLVSPLLAPAGMTGRGAASLPRPDTASEEEAKAPEVKAAARPNVIVQEEEGLITDSFSATEPPAEMPADASRSAASSSALGNRGAVRHGFSAKTDPSSAATTFPSGGWGAPYPATSPAPQGGPGNGPGKANGMLGMGGNDVKGLSPTTRARDSDVRRRNPALADQTLGEKPLASTAPPTQAPRVSKPYSVFGSAAVPQATTPTPQAPQGDRYNTIYVPQAPGFQGQSVIAGLSQSGQQPPVAPGATSSVPAYAPPAPAGKPPVAGVGQLGLPGPTATVAKPVYETRNPVFGRRLEGQSSLKIDYQEEPLGDGVLVAFLSLGVDPRVDVRVANRPQWALLGWAVGLAVALAGVLLTRRRAAVKARYVVLVILAATVLPLIPRLENLVGPCNMAVYAAGLLVPYYLLAGIFRGLFELLRRRRANAALAAGAAAIALVVLAVIPAGMAGEPQGGQPTGQATPAWPPGLTAARAPVKVPDDAILVPYDPKAEHGVDEATRLLVPYDKYVELWNRAYPDKKLEAARPPASYALAGVSYTATLGGDESLVIEGRMTIDVFSNQYVSIPLGLEGGVLSRAELDGKPARLSVTAPVPPPVPQSAGPANPEADPFGQQAPAQGATGGLPTRDLGTGGQAAGGTQTAAAMRPVLLLHVSGKGRHELALSVRMRLERRGGWRVAEGMLPWAPASAMSVTVPEKGTEVRLAHVPDRHSYETAQPGEKLETALGTAGAISLQWRPKVAEGQVDHSLTVRSAALFDVQEDGLRAAWQLTLDFPRSQREFLGIVVPKEYLVEKVEGANVRGWEVQPDAAGQRVQVSLLKAAKDSERLTVRLLRPCAVGQGELAEFDAPLVSVPDASLESGELAIRRSPRLELRPVKTSGVTRTDLGGTGESQQALAASPVEESLLKLRPYQAYRFVALPFSLRLAAAPVAGRVEAELQTILRLVQFDQGLETRIKLDVRERPIYQIAVRLPEGFQLDDVAAPGEFHWAVTRPSGRPLLTIYLTAGQQGEVDVVLHGTLGRQKLGDEIRLPRLEVVDVASQRGEMAVEVDPSLDVQTRDLKECQTVLAATLAGWLTPKQQTVTQLSLETRGPGYSGTLRLSPREPLVTCDTVTNVRITDRAVEETIGLDYNVQHAGIRELTFLLPAWLKDARIQVPLLRQKTIEPIGQTDKKKTPDPFIRVRITLQDAVSGQFRVLVQNDRLLTAAPQQAPIPVVETGRTDRQFVVLESAGRDEVEVVRHPGLEPLGRQQQQWAKLAALLGGNITQAYLVTAPGGGAGVAAGANIPRRAAGADMPQLVVQTRERKALETARAKIGLAFTDLVLDANGAYRAELTCHIDNSTEQYLEIELPEGATLWTARWRSSAQDPGTPVKPTLVPVGSESGKGDRPLLPERPSGFSEQKAPVPFSARRVRIPLVKTAPGELDYEVVLKYGGRMPPVGPLAEVRFPLVHVLRIPVELSQVRLYLPETHAWFHFGGTMGRVEEAEQAAGQVGYETKVIGRLKEDMASSNPFTQARAANNLKQIGLGLLNFESAVRDLPPGFVRNNIKLQEELARKESVRKEAEKAAEQIQQAPQQEAAVQDNRYLLNQRFNEQRAKVSGNEVKSAGRNWDVSGGESKAAESSEAAQYNPQWLDQQADFAKERGALSADRKSFERELAGVKERVVKRAGGKFKAAQANEPPAEPQVQLLLPNAPPSENKPMGGEQANQPQKAYPVADLVLPVQPPSSQSGGGRAAGQSQPAFQPPQRADTQQAKANRYQQEQLQKQALPQSYSMNDDASYRQGGGGGGRRAPSAQPAPAHGQAQFGTFASDLEIPFQAGATPRSGSAPPADGASAYGAAVDNAGAMLPAASAVQPSAGLASLDVAIPLRGTVYFFSTPRGEAEITAQAASGRLLTGLGQAAAIALAALAVWYVFAAVRRGRFAWLASRRTATVFLVAGVLAFCFLPGIAILAIAAGSGILVHNLLQSSNPAGN